MDPIQHPLHPTQRSLGRMLSLCGVLLLLNACGPATSASIVAVTPLPPAALTITPVNPPKLGDESPVITKREANQSVTPSATRSATPTPLSIQLEQGEAAALAAAADALLKPTPRQRISFTQSPVPLTFDEFYDSYDMRTGLTLSDKLVSLDGQQVVLEGYMAPPLKPQLDFFVLTKIRLQYCPFCSTDADWPDDIAVVYLTNNTTAATLKPVRLTGRLEVGSAVDSATGMVSLVRIYADKIEEIQ